MGIYAITNKVTGKQYIGSTRQPFRTRFRGHRKLLRLGKHPNIHLQRAWDKHGEASFFLSVIEQVIAPDLLQSREQFWIDYYGLSKLYNLCPLAYRPLSGLRVLDYPGFVAPDGTVYEDVHNLAEFCRAHGLRKSHLWQVARGTRHSHRGWTHIELSADERVARLADTEPKYYAFLSPDGIEYHNIPNLTHFCLPRSLDASAMLKVYKGKRKAYKGWRSLTAA